jgi:hypothetical protein
LCTFNVEEARGVIKRYAKKTVKKPHAHIPFAAIGSTRLPPPRPHLEQEPPEKNYGKI